MHLSAVVDGEDIVNLHVAAEGLELPFSAEAPVFHPG